MVLSLLSYRPLPIREWRCGKFLGTLQSTRPRAAPSLALSPIQPLSSARTCDTPTSPPLIQPGDWQIPRATHHIATMKPTQALMGGGPKVPYVKHSRHCWYREPMADNVATTGTPSTSGRRPVVGTPSPRTGAQTLPSCSVSLLGSQPWLGP